MFAGAAAAVAGHQENHGGGGQPDPLTVFNSHVELADGELYLLKGEIVLAPALQGSSQRLQPYFSVDLEEHAWLAGKRRKDNPTYLIEGRPSSWRPYEGAYGELAAEAHVQGIVTSSGKVIQVISLRPIPELCRIPRPSRY